MIDKMYVVPQGMTEFGILEMWRSEKAARHLPVGQEWVSEVVRDFGNRAVLGAVKWLTNNPIKPDAAQTNALAVASGSHAGNSGVAAAGAVEWQRRMFLAPEPKVPKELHDLTWRNSVGTAGKVTMTFAEIDARILEAFHRGQKSKETL